MSGFFIDTTAGQIVRLVSGSRFLKYAEERDPSLIEKYINPEKSGNLARTGTTRSDRAPSTEKDVNPESDSPSSSSSTLHDPNALVNVPSGRPVDPERGRDGHVVDWYGPDDLDVRELCHDLVVANANRIP